MKNRTELADFLQKIDKNDLKFTVNVSESTNRNKTNTKPARSKDVPKKKPHMALC